jgi:hypothetical protein
MFRSAGNRGLTFHSQVSTLESAGNGSGRPTLYRTGGRMNHLKLIQLFESLLLLVVIGTFTVSGQTTTSASANQRDSSIRYATVEDMSKRVDSLHFIVVYNAELLRRDLDSKMLLMYVMLGIIIIASVAMYALLKQTQRQRKELEEKLIHQVSASVADLEAKIKLVEAGLSSPKASARKKRTK